MISVKSLVGRMVLATVYHIPLAAFRQSVFTNIATIPGSTKGRVLCIMLLIIAIAACCILL